MNEDIEIEPWYRSFFHMLGGMLCLMGMHAMQGVQQGERVHPTSRLIRIYCKRDACDVQYIVVDE